MLKALLKKKIDTRKRSIRKTAEEIKVSHTTLRRALRGDPMDLATVMKFAEWLEVSPTELLNNRGPSQGGLSELIFLAISRAPKLAEAFEDVIKAINDGAAPADLVEDIAAYAAFRLKVAAPKQN